VRHRLDPVVALDALDDVDRPVAGRAAGAVGHRREVGLERGELVERGVEIALPVLGLGREELEREDRLVLGREDVVDSHGRKA
jgi:hypothetical protein